ncbi:MAG: hypothetical protein K8U03_03460 [Planctomycetia bacterium]|nr:hypothetical protein [Planctomycetia bacterium]
MSRFKVSLRPILHVVAAITLLFGSCKWSDPSRLSESGFVVLRQNNKADSKAIENQLDAIESCVDFKVPRNPEWLAHGDGGNGNRDPKYEFYFWIARYDEQLNVPILSNNEKRRIHPASTAPDETLRRYLAAMTGQEIEQVGTLWEGEIENDRHLYKCTMATGDDVTYFCLERAVLLR